MVDPRRHQELTLSTGWSTAWYTYAIHCYTIWRKYTHHQVYIFFPKQDLRPFGVDFSHLASMMRSNLKWGRGRYNLLRGRKLQKIMFYQAWECSSLFQQSWYCMISPTHWYDVHWFSMKSPLLIIKSPLKKKHEIPLRSFKRALLSASYDPPRALRARRWWTGP